MNINLSPDRPINTVNQQMNINNMNRGRSPNTPIMAINPYALINPITSKNTINQNIQNV